MEIAPKEEASLEDYWDDDDEDDDYEEEEEEEDVSKYKGIGWDEL